VENPFVNIHLSHRKWRKQKSSLSFLSLLLECQKSETQITEKHYYNYNVFVFISPKFLFPPESVLKSFLEHKSCACVVCFARFALTQAGSYNRKRYRSLSEELAKPATWSASGQAELNSQVKIWVLKTMPKPSPTLSGPVGLAHFPVSTCQCHLSQNTSTFYHGNELLI